LWNDSEEDGNVRRDCEVDEVTDTGDRAVTLIGKGRYEGDVKRNAQNTIPTE